MSPSSTSSELPRESTKCVHVECVTPFHFFFVIGTDEDVPAKPQSSCRSESGDGTSGLKKRRSTKVLSGLVRTRVVVGSKRVGCRLSGFLAGRWMEYGTGVLGGRG
jgi:hypothetical protein